jgi:predicted nucleic-acid-binding Zn-ribbon protein
VRTGICPKCGSHKVYSGGGGSRQATCTGIARTAFLPDQHLTSYVCAVCGYTESYIADPNALRDIARSWDRVYPTPYR